MRINLIDLYPYGYRYLRKISTLFFLFVFLSTKVSGLHILNHGDDHEDLAHCILCDHATAFNGTPVLLASVQELEVKVVPVFVDKEITSLYDVPFFSTNFSHKLFTRPPPQFVH